MRELHSFLACDMMAFIDLRTATGCWNDTYESYLHQFDKHCTQKYPEEVALSEEMVESFCGQRATELANTCRVRSYAISNFVDYLKKRGATDISLPPIPAKKPSGYIPHAFTEPELDRFFSVSDDLPLGKPNSLASRLRRIAAPVFFRLLYSSGIRTNEARMLRIEDVDLAQGVLNIRKSKGYSQHYVALHETMADLLREYDRAVCAICPGRTYFFPSPRYVLVKRMGQPVISFDLV